MKVTLADIAEKANVAPSTVYRALNDKPGVSEEKKNDIKRIAEDMGYIRNYHASLLKRGTLHIAVMLPWGEEKHTFGWYLWRGIEQYVAEKKSTSIELIHLPYAHIEELSDRLLQVFNGDHGKIDGVISFGSSFDAPNHYMSELQQKGVPVVNVISESHKKSRLTTVKLDAEMTGRMAANLLLEFNNNRSYSKVLVIGDFRGSNQHANSVGFEREVWNAENPLEVLKITNPSHLSPEHVKQQIHNTLSTNDGIGAIYCCNAIGTLPMVEVLTEMGLEKKIYTIGSDVLPGSVKAVYNRKLNAIIHNRPIHIGYHAMEIMANYLIQEIKPAPTVELASLIVMKGNLEYYAQENEIDIEWR